MNGATRRLELMSSVGAAQLSGLDAGGSLDLQAGHVQQRKELG